MVLCDTISPTLLYVSTGFFDKHSDATNAFSYNDGISIGLDDESLMVNLLNKDEYIEQKTKYQESLRKEQKYWNDLLECRKNTSRLLTDDIKKVYDIGTNQMLRTKLYQLKNQNQDLGMISGEVMKCALPEDCSDKALLDYPGFNIIWAKHCENLDWYPNFE